MSSSSLVTSSRYYISSASTFPILFLAKKQQRTAAGTSRLFECPAPSPPPLFLKNNAIARVRVGVGVGVRVGMITTDISLPPNKNVNTFQGLSDHNSLFYPPRPKTKSPQPGEGEGEGEGEEEEVVKVCDGNGSKKKKKNTFTLDFDNRAIAAAFLVLLLQISIVPILPSVVLLYPPSASAVLYSPDTKVPRTGELALRKAIPANANMKAIQDSLEDISYLLRIPQRKPYGTMEADVKKALKIAKEEKESILSGIPAELKGKGTLLYNSLTDGKGGLQNLIEYIKEKDADKVSVSLASTLDTVAELELLQAPGLSFLLPGQYLKYPRLTGRGTVEFVIEKGDGSTFFPAAGGEAKNLATIQVVIDGYSAPLTAGNFAKLVIDGAYDGVIVKCSDQAVLADNELNQSGYSVPLEVMPSGQFEPLYKSTLSVQDGELPVLPLSVYGAVAMAHSRDSEEYSSPSQFFFYLYDKRNAGLGGLSFDEGQFSVFGYTTAGRDILSQIKSGDVVRSAKLVQGGDRLIVPNEK